MKKTSITYRGLPLPFREEKKREVQQMSRSTDVSQQKRARDTDFPSQSSYHMTRLRLVALVIVLLGVTLSMLASFVFLFSGTLVGPHLPVLPSSLSLVGLECAGIGVGVLLCSMLTFILKQPLKRRSAQEHTSRPIINPLATGGRTVLPPEPMNRQVSDGFSSQRDRWISSEWKGEPQRQTEELKALHVRQRLQTLRLSYTDDFPGDNGQKKRYQIKKRNGTIVQIKTDAFLEEGVDASF